MLVMSWGSTLAAQGRSTDFTIWAGTSQLLEQVWTLAFWLTLLVLLFAVLNEITARQVRPLQ
jgi:hypothetical protein